MSSPDHRDCSWHSFCLFIGIHFFCWFGLGFLFLFVLATSIHWCYLLNSEILVSSGSLILATAWYNFLCPADEYLVFLILSMHFPPLQTISKIDFHQILIKKILVNLMNTLVILGTVKWVETPTFNLFHNITMW